MGKTAKVHKRLNKRKLAGGSSTLLVSSRAQTSQTQVQAAKKKAGLKNKSKPNNSPEDGLLGGADYVSILMGGRRKAKSEAQKLSRAQE